MNSKNIHLMLADERLIELNYKRLKTPVKTPKIKAEIEVIIKSSTEVHIQNDFNFKDMNINIKGQLIRVVKFQGDNEELEDVVKALCEETDGDFFEPVYAKTSQIISSLTADAYLYPLIIPISAWHESSQSSYKIFNELDE